MINERNLDVPLTQLEQLQFDRLWRTSQPQAYRYALRLTGNRAEAEDLAADAYLRACRKFHNYQPERPFENWIFRILDRLNIDRKRMEGRRVRSVSFDSPLQVGSESVYFEPQSALPTPEEEVVDLIPSADLQSAMKGLSPTYRNLLIDVFVHQITIRELAEEGTTCEGTLRSRLHRAIKHLKSNLNVLGARSIQV